ncbi:MAG: hypothetical protein H0U95_10615 [Bacteroidetes bacterium]|nr:hypothetical protein [Bacteroidota bacterium]
MEKRSCPECGEIIKGRIDKKFCSDMCRNAFNNKVNSDTNNYVRNINNALRKNRRLLEESLKGSDKTTVAKQKLIDKGFNFKYFTHQLVTKNNHAYVYCYEFGYLIFEQNMVLIVRKKADN